MTTNPARFKTRPGMIAVVAPNPPVAFHLYDVKSEMRKRGAPRIRLVERGHGLYYAVEGSHRLAAADALGLTPQFKVMRGRFKTSQAYGVFDWRKNDDDAYVTPAQFVCNVERNNLPEGRVYYFDYAVIGEHVRRHLQHAV